MTDMNSALMKLAQDERPDLIEKTAHAVAELELISPELAQEVSAEIGGILLHATEKGKTAAVSEATREAAKAFGGRAGNFGMVLGGTLVAGLGAAIASDLYDAAKRGLTKGGNFRRIMEANPKLKSEHSKGDLARAFSTLHRYGPEFSADPLVGGALLSHIASFPEMSHKQVIELISARKNLSEAKSKFYSPSGLSNLGGQLVDTRSKGKPEAKP